MYCCYLFEMRSGLHFPDRLHESVSYYDADIGSGVSIRFAGQLTQVCLGQTVRRVTQMQAKHGRSRRLLWERDVDTLLKPAQSHQQIQIKDTSLKHKHFCILKHLSD